LHDLFYYAINKLPYKYISNLQNTASFVNIWHGKILRCDGLFATRGVRIEDTLSSRSRQHPKDAQVCAIPCGSGCPEAFPMIRLIDFLV